jgi:predicted dehydrogenase
MIGTAAAATAALATTAKLARGAPGANERLAVGFIGAGGQANAHMRGLNTMKDVTVAAICDVDPSRQSASAMLVGSSPRLFGDFRKLLEMKDLDAVFVITPDHWHAIPSIAALDAGKHVYFEKPCAHNIREGRAMAEAAKRSGKVTLMGVQQRSGKHWQNAVARLQAGELGKISMVHAWNAWNTDEMFGDLGKPADEPEPAGVDYDMWLGPAPKRAFNPARFHGTWYFFWDYGGGMVSGWAVHLFDVVFWAMGPELQSAVMSGGRQVFDDCRESPDTATAVFECPGYTFNYTMRHGNGWRPHGDMDHGIEFFGDKGTLHINRNGYQLYRTEDRDKRKPHEKESAAEDALVAHKRHFFDCIRKGVKSRCDAQTGHQSTVPCHLANISYRVGRKVRWNSKTEEITSDAEASKLLTREYRAPWHV